MLLGEHGRQEWSPLYPPLRFHAAVVHAAVATWKVERQVKPATVENKNNDDHFATVSP